MRTRVVVLGAGFGGLELATVLSEALGESLDLVLLDRDDAFVFGFSKLDVMFGRQLPAAVRHPYRDIGKPGVRFVHTSVRSFDPAAKRVVTDAGTFDADFLVVALGADLDAAATPGLVDGGHEFYSNAGAFAARDMLARFEGGPAIVGVCGGAFKCPPAPSETAFLLHDLLTARTVRSEITVVMPFPAPVPPSPDTSSAILAAFAERGITFVRDTRVKSLDPGRKVAMLSDGRELPYALFLGIPVHRVPQVVVDSGLAESARPRRECSRRAPRTWRRSRSWRGSAARRRPSATRARAPATWSSAAARWAASTWTSSAVPGPRAGTSRRPRRWSPRSADSARAGSSAGSASSPRP
jgi:sulfide:quinone oxidoreductase